MTVYETIKADLTTARLAKNSREVKLLSTLLGEMDLAAVVLQGAKLVDDTVALGVVKKFLKGNAELLSLKENDPFLLHEREIFSKYQPAQMTANDIRAAITISGFKKMPEIMGYLKREHAGRYDGKLASEVAKEFV